MRYVADAATTLQAFDAVDTYAIVAYRTDYIALWPLRHAVTRYCFHTARQRRQHAAALYTLRRYARAPRAVTRATFVATYTRYAYDV